MASGVPAADALASSKTQCMAPSRPREGVKRRAPRACLSCRNRKVRCDVMRGINPCTNCRLDSLSCVLANSSRGRRVTNTDSDGNVDVFQMEVVSAVGNENEREHSNGFLDRNTSGVRDGSLGDNPHGDLDGSVNANPHGMPGGLPAVHERPRTDNLPVSLTFEAPNTATNTRHPSEQPQDSTRATPDANPGVVNHLRGVNFFSPQSTDQQLPRLPAFLRPLPSHLGSRDVQYLVDVDALTIPDEQLQNELLRTFVQYIYPSMPILDLADFLSPIVYSDRDLHKPISLLLFQAVMFVSVTFVPLEALHQAGLHSRRKARKAFFQRVRLLYSLDYEPDHLPLLQALLLMTYWYESPRDKKDTWYWMGISLSLVQVLGFHRDPEHLNISPQAKRLQRRIWWSCFMRDRLLALGLRRPTRIRQDEYNVRMLTLDDFETTPLLQDILSGLSAPTSFAQDPTLWRTMSTVCIETAKLCVCIGNLLFSQYSVLGDQSVRDDRTNLVVPRRSAAQVRDMAKYDVELSEWHRRLGPECRYTAVAPPSEQQGGRHVIRLQQALLHMIFLTAVMALHRPRALKRSPDTGVDEARVKESKTKVTEAAIGVTDIVYDLQRRGQLGYLSTTGIPAILWATLSHVMGICSPDEGIRASSIGRFFQCRQGLEALRELYASADHAVWFLEAVIRKTGVQIPMLGMVVRADHGPDRSERTSAQATDPEPLPDLWMPDNYSFENDFMLTSQVDWNDQIWTSISAF